MKPTFEELLSLAEVCSTLPEFQNDNLSFDEYAVAAHSYLRHWWPDIGDERVEDLCYCFWWYANAMTVVAFKKDLLEAYNDLTHTQ